MDVRTLRILIPPTPASEVPQSMLWHGWATLTQHQGWALLQPNHGPGVGTIAT